MHLQLLQLALICLLPPFLLPVSSSCATNLHICHSRVRGALISTAQLGTAFPETSGLTRDEIGQSCTPV